MYSELTTQIVFFYPTDTILDRLKMYSQYVSRTNESDESFITDDELDLIKVEAGKALLRIFQEAVKLSKGITDSFFEDQAYGTYGNCYGFRLNNYHGHNPNILPIIDRNIERLWTSMILASWYLISKNEALYKKELMEQSLFFIAYNNSLTELYKPYIGSVTPDITVVDAEVDDESGELITDDTPTPTEMTDPLYFDTYGDFPTTGVVDTTYVDKSAGVQYYWNGTAYVPFVAQNKTFTVDFEDTDTVTVEHNLNKTMPTVVMTDADGDDWEVDYEPIDANNGVVSWEGNKTGTLYLS